MTNRYLIENCPKTDCVDCPAFFNDVCRNFMKTCVVVMGDRPDMQLLPCKMRKLYELGILNNEWLDKEAE